MFTFAVKEMMRYYKWHYVGVLVENVTNYKWCYEDLVRNVGADSFQMFYLKPVVLYSLTDDYSSLKNKISSFKDKVSSKLNSYISLMKILLHVLRVTLQR